MDECSRAPEDRGGRAGRRPAPIRWANVERLTGLGGVGDEGLSCSFGKGVHWGHRWASSGHSRLPAPPPGTVLTGLCAWCRRTCENSHLHWAHTGREEHRRAHGTHVPPEGPASHPGSLSPERLVLDPVTKDKPEPDSGMALSGTQKKRRGKAGRTFQNKGDDRRRDKITDRGVRS